MRKCGTSQTEFWPSTVEHSESRYLPALFDSARTGSSNEVMPRTTVVCSSQFSAAGLSPPGVFPLPVMTMLSIHASSAPELDDMENLMVAPSKPVRSAV